MNLKYFIISVVYLFLNIPPALVMEGSRKIMNPNERHFYALQEVQTEAFLKSRYQET